RTWRANLARGAGPSLSPDRLVTKKVPARGLRRYGAAVRFAAMENQHGSGRRGTRRPAVRTSAKRRLNYITKLLAPNDVDRSVLDESVCLNAFHALPCLLNFDERVFEELFNRLQNLWTGNGSDGS